AAGGARRGRGHRRCRPAGAAGAGAARRHRRHRHRLEPVCGHAAISRPSVPGCGGGPLAAAARRQASRLRCAYPRPAAGAAAGRIRLAGPPCVAGPWRAGVRERLRAGRTGRPTCGVRLHGAEHRGLGRRARARDGAARAGRRHGGLELIDHQNKRGDMDSDVIGFVGIGKMGQPMARRLVDAGRRLVVYDVDAGATAPLVALGAKAAGSVSEVADAAGTVLLSLPAPRVVQDVVAQLAGGAKVKRVVDFSTIGPAAAASAAATLDARGIAYIDAPVSGGVPGAQAGTLAVMVSCPKALFETLQELLGTFGKTFHVGEQAGQAQTLTLAHNLLSATAIAISPEALAMGVKAGLDPRVMLDIINAGSGRN